MCRGAWGGRRGRDRGQWGRGRGRRGQGNSWALDGGVGRAADTVAIVLSQDGVSDAPGGGGQGVEALLQMQGHGPQ